MLSWTLYCVRSFTATYFINIRSCATCTLDKVPLNENETKKLYKLIIKLENIEINRLIYFMIRFKHCIMLWEIFL